MPWLGPNLGELPIGSAGLAVFRRYQLRQRQSGGGLEKFAAAHGYILHARRYYPFDNFAHVQSMTAIPITPPTSEMTIAETAFVGRAAPLNGTTPNT